ncbi:1-deoxy-D-xylulose-5-phosphate synthase [Actinoplanes friuliensis]|uniref:1-deoxy-D-xylulose-5-phosphate synthase n=1 Tax=Actinoplanes friuliensis DSM 7358 TaxID=1246995 RepID=U5VWC1_9ACTN|nr:1-deoxy-D-xylulose-5-phosphate synthase [Actinoplanes friuliensis]AGZ41149.1 1-deoxy-D-xylulose-5-phosphate synthase [Actinoplanes friuliensis DSM 7358]
MSERGQDLLGTIRGPQDLKGLDAEQMTALGAEIRAFLIAKVARTGGHIGPNLGVVELTLAMHRVFDSPRDRFIFDTGHQAYVHKMVTGRQEGFDRLKRRGGLTGYPSRAESEHDLVENCHASTALSYADGMAKAYALRGEARHVVAVVGDGALTGGMCWEALNNIAATRNPLVIIVNDNGRSYAPTVGGLADHLASLRLSPGYEKGLELIKDTLGKTPLVGKPLFGALHAAKRGIKDAVAPQAMFEDLGIKYFGPVDGHDLAAMESALARAKGYGGPVIVHAVTQKGRGYAPAEQDEADRLHAPGAFDPETGRQLAAPSLKWTKVFADELVALAGERPDIVGITAAMPESTGIDALAAAYPDRAFDVGIAEQHATTSAAGLALAGLHPVVAIYATFLNRAFDQVLLDVALHRLPVTFVLDRAGVTGPDGPSHYGIWDMSLLGVVPGLRVAAPRDAETLRTSLREAVAISDGPTVVRFPSGSVPATVPALRRVGSVDVLAETPERKDVLLVTVGRFAQLGVQVAAELEKRGIGVTVVNPLWVRPVPVELVGLAGAHRLVVTVEDGVRNGGIGDAVAKLLRDHELDVPLRDLGVPVQWIDHGTRAEILAEIGLTAADITERVQRWTEGLSTSDQPVRSSIGRD